MAAGPEKKQVIACLVRAIISTWESADPSPYLLRGRRFSGFTNQELRQHWAMTFKAWVQDRQRSPELDELAAEFQLRSMPLPFDTVLPEMTGLRALIGDIDA